MGVSYVVHQCPRLMRALNAGDAEACAHEFLDINRAGGKVLAGLTERRRAEAKLFLSGGLNMVYLKWLALMPASFIMAIVGRLLAPILPFFVDKETHRLPDWLSWFATDDNDADGDQGHWERWPGTDPWSTYKRRVAWLLRNVCYGFDIDVLGVRVYPTDDWEVRGNEDASDTNGVSGTCIRALSPRWKTHRFPALLHQALSSIRQAVLRAREFWVEAVGVSRQEGTVRRYLLQPREGFQAVGTDKIKAARLWRPNGFLIDLFALRKALQKYPE